MAASVSSPAGSENVRAKGQGQRQKWIPAFAGMTIKTPPRLVANWDRHRTCPYKPTPLPPPLTGGKSDASLVRGFQQPPDKGGFTARRDGKIVFRRPEQAHITPKHCWTPRGANT